jgi:hypothetical protein
MNWPSRNDAQFNNLAKPGKLNPQGLSSRIPHWIHPLDSLMSPFFDFRQALITLQKWPK